MREVKTVEQLLIASHAQRDKQEWLTAGRLIIIAALLLISTGLFSLYTGG